MFSSLFLKNHKLRTLWAFFSFIITFGLFSFSYAASSQFYLSSGAKAAVSGYDTVAYFTEQRAVKGNPRFVSEWKGTKWLFASADNQKEFEANPEKYVPRYGGYCAFAVANNSTAPGDPLQWSIVNNRLYLNISGGVKKRWLSNKEQFIAQGDKNWPNVLNR